LNTPLIFSEYKLYSSITWMNSSLFERDHWTLRGPHRARHTRKSETRIETVDCRFFPSGFKAFRIVFQHWVEMQWRWKINNNFERSPFLSFHSTAASTCVSALFGIPVWLRRLTTHTNRQKRLRRMRRDTDTEIYSRGLRYRYGDSMRVLELRSVGDTCPPEKKTPGADAFCKNLVDYQF